MSKGSVVTLVVVVVLLLGGMFVWKGMQRSKAETEARAAVPQLLAHITAYKEHRGYIDGLLKEGHAAAFEKAYVGGSLFTPSEYDEQVYVETMIAFIAERAKADGREDVAKGMPGTHKKDQGVVDREFGG